MRKILVIEDEDNTRKVIAYDLSKAGYDVDEACEGKTGLEKALNKEYDLIIVDWMLPEIDGIEIIKTVREKKKNSILFMVSAKNSQEDIVQAFKAGADDYMTKPLASMELVARVYAHIKRLRNDGEIKEFMDIVVDDSRHAVYIHEKKVDLTKKEYDLLNYFVLNNNIVLSRDKILNDLWGFDYDDTTRIVDVHTFKLRNKLKDSNVTISSIRGIGYIMKAKEED